MLSDLDHLTQVLRLTDELERLHDENVQLRVASAMYQKYWIHALERAKLPARLTTRRHGPLRLTMGDQ